MNILIMFFVLAPIYLLPRLFRTDSGEALYAEAAHEIVAQMPPLNDIHSITVDKISQDWHGELAGDLERELLADGRWIIMSFNRSRSRVEHDDKGQSNANAATSNATLICTIERDEMAQEEHLLRIEAKVLRAQDSEVLWATQWRRTATLQSHDLDLKKSAVVICLALAAGVLIVFVRKEDPPRETIRQW